MNTSRNNLLVTFTYHSTSYAQGKDDKHVQHNTFKVFGRHFLRLKSCFRPLSRLFPHVLIPFDTNWDQKGGVDQKCKRIHDQIRVKSWTEIIQTWNVFSSAENLKRKTIVILSFSQNWNCGRNWNKNIFRKWISVLLLAKITCQSKGYS